MADLESPLTAADIDLIVSDFDGVLTDNRVFVFEDGREVVLYNRADGLAFDTFRNARMLVWILSTEQNPVVKARASKFRMPVQSGLGDKAAALDKLCSDNGFLLA